MTYSKADPISKQDDYVNKPVEDLMSFDDLDIIDSKLLNSDTSNQSINLNGDGSSDSLSNVDVFNKNEKLQNELEVILRNKGPVDIDLIKQLSTVNDTSSNTTASTNEDELNSQEEDEEAEGERKSVLKLKEKFQNQNLIKSKKSLDFKQMKKRSINLINLSEARITLFSDSVLVAKLNLNKLEDDKQQALAQKQWERKWVTLSDDRQLTIYSSKNDLKPNDILLLNNFQLASVNETTLELIRSCDLNVGGESRIKTKSFINLFEFTNYEIKFTNNDNKNILFNLINQMINTA